MIVVARVWYSIRHRHHVWEIMYNGHTGERKRAGAAEGKRDHCTVNSGWEKEVWFAVL